MPRVVPDQKWKFENDELFRKLGVESQVRYTGAKDKQTSEKSANLMEDCKRKQVEIAFVGCGITLTLLFKSVVFEKDPGLESDYIQLDLQTREVRMVSPFIFNGVCVLFRGWLDIDTLEGKGHLEFDPDAAMAENDRLHRGQSNVMENFYHGNVPKLSLVESLSGSLHEFGYHIDPTFYGFCDNQPSASPETSAQTLESSPAPSSTAQRSDSYSSPDSSAAEQIQASPHEDHWKKRLRKVSEPLLQLDLANPPFPKTFMADKPDSSEDCGAGPRHSGTQEPEAILDLSISSKTYPSSRYPSHEKRVSLDETVSSFDNFSLLNRGQTPTQSQKVSRSGSGIIPKKKYWSMEFHSTPEETRRDSSTQTTHDLALDTQPGRTNVTLRSSYSTSDFIKTQIQKSVSEDDPFE